MQNNKRIIFAISIILLIFLFILVQSSADSEQKIKVIVTMKDESPNSAKLMMSSFSEFSGIKIRQKFDSSFSAEIDENMLDTLKNNPKIKEVIKMSKVYAILQNSTKIINATQTWSTQYNNINLTGAGQTVCIIDTGVNRTHPDLQNKIVAEYCYCSSPNCCPSGTAEEANASDDNGHGTHVAGIVAANGVIKGVAPDAKIVAIKVLDAAGGGWPDEEAKAIDWCVNNASLYNISVISLSLGCNATKDGYTSYCDSISDGCSNIELAASINKAILKNITVVVATGNYYNWTAITSPACITNATPVSATKKDDSIDTDYANRNFMVQLFAPGTDINSTAGPCLDICQGNYGSLSGTSMATPHVSGAIAIINQLLKMTGRSKTTQQTESLLNSTGKQIHDSQSGLNFSRINIYDAIRTMSFDYVSLISPQNNLVTNQNQTFYCNSSSPVGLINVTFYLWNSTGLENSTNQQISGFFNFTNISYNFIHTGNYKWNCLFTNNLSFAKSADSNFSLTFDYDIIAPNITFGSQTETSGSKIKRSNIIVNVSANDTYFANLTVYLFNLISLVNATTSLSNSTFLNFTNVPDGIYFFNATAYDYFGNFNSTETRNVTIDANPPYYLSISQQNYTYGLSGYSFNSVWNDTIGMSAVWLAVYSPSQANYTAVYNSTYSNYISNTSVLAAGNYSFQWFANDTSGNLNSTSIYNFSVLQANPSVNLSFNVSDSGAIYYKDILVENGTLVNISATANAEGPIILYLNDSMINSGINLVSNRSQVNVTVNATVFYNSTQNYSSSSLTRIINVEASNLAPTGNLVSPSNNNYANKTNVTFKISATDATLKNATLYIWNSTTTSNYSRLLTNTTSMTGMSNNTNWTYNLSDGNYLWNAFLYDFSNNGNFIAGNNSLTVDTIYPTATVTLSSPNIDTAGSAAIGCSSFDAHLDSLKIYVGSDAVKANSSLTVTSLTINYTLLGSTGIGTYKINCTAVDKAGNSYTDSKTLTITSPPVTPPSSPGGGTTILTTNNTAPAIETTQTLNEIIANIPANITIPTDVAKEGITKISITTLVNASNVEINLKKIESSVAPTGAGANVYKYFNITAKNLNDSSIKTVYIHFEIPQSWITSNNINTSTIKLKRYKTAWNELMTEKLSEDSTNVYLRAETPGFSLFAITADKIVIYMSTSAGGEESPAAGISKKTIMLGGLVIAFLALVAFIYFGFLRKNGPEKLGAVVE
jgi:PGF-pre-PGF domain-containing protein